MRDNVHCIDVKNLVSPKNQTNTTNPGTTTIDRAGYDSVTFIVQTGTLNNLAAELKLKHGDTSSSLTNVSNSDLIGATTGGQMKTSGSNDNQFLKVGYIGGKRYIQALLDVTTASSNNYVAAHVILGHPAKIPTPDRTF